MNIEEYNQNILFTGAMYGLAVENFIITYMNSPVNKTSFWIFTIISIILTIHIATIKVSKKEPKVKLIINKGSYKT